MIVGGLHAVVTGGGSGIGAAIAAALLHQGAAVTVMGRDEKRLRERCKLLRKASPSVRPELVEGLANAAAVRFVTMDVSDPASVQAAFDSAAAFAPIDILINNAGEVESVPFVCTSLALWQRLLDVNLTGTFLCTRQALPGMCERGFGRIVNVASTAALSGYAYVAAYCAAKHGVLGLTRSLALEVARRGVTVNAVCPGYTDTAIVDRAVEKIADKTGRGAEAARAALASANPQGRLVQPEEVAYTVAWLCRRESASINGQAIAVAGGEVM